MFDARDHTASGLPLKGVYTAEDVAGISFEEIGLPGEYPFVRGPYPTMYRGRTWTMRQIAGYGTPSDTNERFRYLLAQGQTGLSVDFDMPTLMGYDSDDPFSEGEVGREGVAVDTLDDLEALFKGIDLENISVSMTINPTAWILVAMYAALAESRGNDLKKISGTAQTDILKELLRRKNGSSRSARRCGLCVTSSCSARNTCRDITQSTSAAITSQRLAQRRCRKLLSRSPKGLRTTKKSAKLVFLPISLRPRSPVFCS